MMSHKFGLLVNQNMQTTKRFRIYNFSYDITQQYQAIGSRCVCGVLKGVLKQASGSGRKSAMSADEQWAAGRFHGADRGVASRREDSGAG
jgi:hypothetical protein